MNKSLPLQSFYDELTHLPGRQLLLDCINQGIVKTGQSELLLAVLFINLDNFNDINKKLGHDIGDEVLKIIAVRLSASVRGSDTASRVAGDEFIIVLSEINAREDAKNVAQKIITAITLPVYVSEHQLTISANIGIAICPFDGMSAIDLIKKASLAMYAAKNEGNTYHFYS